MVQSRTTMTDPRKVVIIGAEAVGSTFMQSGLARDIVLIDIDKERAQGGAMDLNHGLFLALPVCI